MKKKVYNLLILVVIGVIVSIMPCVVNAASITSGSKTTDGNLTKIPINLEVGEDESLDSVTLGCALSSADVTCSFEGSSSVASNGTKDKYIFKPASTSTFTNGTTTLGYVVITNNESSSSSVTVTLSSQTTGIKDLTFSVTPAYTTQAKTTAAALSDDANLNSLTVSQGTMAPTFSTDVYEYTVYNIPDTINSVNISYECRTSGCSMSTLEGGKSTSGKKIYLNDGENNVKITISSQSGTKSATYTLNIIRGESSYDSSKLASLSFGDYELSPTFASDTTEYTLSVPNSINSLSTIMEYVLADEKATAEVEGIDNFKEGENTLTIAVTNESGSETTTYTITVTRLSEEEIIIKRYYDGEITFTDADGEEQTMTEDEFKEAYPEEWEKIENGDYEFDEEGYIVEDEEKEEEKKKKPVWLIVLLIVVGLGVIAVAGYFIFRKKKGKDDKKGKKGKDKKSKEEAKEDEKKDEIEEETEENENKKAFDEDSTMDIDEALNDLMSTKQYDFTDKD